MRLLSLIKKDLLLTTKNYFFYVTLFMALLMVVVIKFVVPEDVSIDPKLYVVFEYEAPQGLIDGLENEGYEVLADRARLDEQLVDNIQSFGMIYKDATTVEYRLQGYENQRYQEFLELNTQFMFKTYGSDVEVVVTDLKDFSKVEDTPFNELLLPLFLVMEPALLGMFLIATMIFSEKEEDTITAFATTPMSINSFIFSKTVVLSLLGLMSLLVTTVLILGSGPNYILLILMTIVCSFMGSSLGLLLASFFNNISSAMLWIIGGSLLLSMPFMTYFSPSFSPVWMKALPTYYMLFAYKEAVFPTGNSGVIFLTMAICLVVGVIAYALSVVKYGKVFRAL